MSKFYKNFHSKMSIFLIGIIALTNCNNELNMKLEERTEYSIITPDGREIVYSPVDLLLVLEFSDDISNLRKQEIIDEFELKLLPTPLRKKQPIQSIEEPTLVFGITKGKSSAIRRQIIKKYPEDVKGALPAFTHEKSKAPSFLRPTTFGIVFYLDVTQDSARNLLDRHNLSIPQNWIEDKFYAYYAMRLVHVNISKRNALFDVIHSLSKEPEIYSAFPLYVDGGYALHHGPSPISLGLTNVKKTLPYVHKIGGRLRQIFWVWKTASTSVVKEFSRRSGIAMFQDSVEVDIKLNKMNLDEVHQLLIENRVRPLSSINERDKSLGLKGIVRWLDIESFIANEEVERVYTVDYLTIEGEFNLEEVPPPPQ